jgi:hypothetical protein
VDCKVHVLWNVSGELCNAQGIEFRDDYPNHVAARVEQGSPLLPGCAGALICTNRMSFCSPVVALMIPEATFLSEERMPGSGKPNVTTVSPTLGWGAASENCDLVWINICLYDGQIGGWVPGDDLHG